MRLYDALITSKSSCNRIISILALRNNACMNKCNYMYMYSKIYESVYACTWSK